MTVSEILELKQAGMTTEEIATLAQHVTSAPAPIKTETSDATANIVAEIQAGLKQMQEELTAIKSVTGEQLKDMTNKMYGLAVNTPTGAEPVDPTNTETAASEYIASIINPTTKQPVMAGGVTNA